MQIQVIKTLALGYKIQDFIDPEGEEETLLVEPVYPNLEDPDYLVQVEDQRRQIQAYDYKKKGFIQVQSKIQETIDINLLYYTFNCNTVQ